MTSPEGRPACHGRLVELGSPLDLAVTRIAVCIVVLLSSELWEASEWAERASVLRAPPEGLEWALGVLAGYQYWLAPLSLVCAGSTLCALLGIRTKAALVVSALTSAVLFALPHLGGGPRHSMHLVWFLAILAAGPADHRLRLPWLRGPPARQPSLLAVTLCMTALRLALACVYFFPGLWKIRESGLDWIFSDNLQNQMYWKWLQFGRIPSLRVDHYPALVQAGALAVVVLELSFPLLIWDWRTRLVAAAFGLAFHVCADTVMFLPFSALWGCYAMLVDWERVSAWLHDRRATVHRISRASLWSSLTRRLASASRRPAAVVAGAVIGGVLTGAVAQGFRGDMQAYPFACYPTFQWIARSTMPDLWVAIVRDGKEQWLQDSPVLGGRRPQSRWAAAWRAAGVFGAPPTADGLRRYYERLPTRPELLPEDRIRFYRAQILVTPEAWDEPPEQLTLVGEIVVPP